MIRDHRDTEDREKKVDSSAPPDPLTEEVVGLAIAVHREFGPWLLEWLAKNACATSSRATVLNSQGKFRSLSATKASKDGIRRTVL
jgi:hypothetical protein